MEDYFKNKQIKGIIFFDSSCGLCQHSVQFLLKRDSKNKFLYAPLDGKTAEIYLFNNKEQFSIKKNSIAYYNRIGLWRASDAILWILKDLSLFWSISFIFKIIPRSLRDPFYFLVGKYRNIFFKNNFCWKPQKDFQKFFLD